MKTPRLLVALLVALLACVAVGDDAKPPPADAHAWPRTFHEGGLTFTIHQPQLEKWDGVKLLARAAVSVESIATSRPSYGVVWFVARTQIDKEERLVTLDRFAIPRASFASVPEKTDEWLALLRKHFPDHVRVVELDRLESALAAVHAVESTKQVQLGTEAPRIFFSTRPAVLVLIDGEPVSRKVAGTELVRVINTRSLLVRDEKRGRYYLAVATAWLEASTLGGPWTPATDKPDGLDLVKRAALAARECELHDGDAEIAKLLDSGGAPLVHVSTGPAELVEIAGDPELESIPGTDLLWVRNSDASILHEGTTRSWYVLVSGRWFRGRSLEGPFELVRARELPRDFAKIPASHPAGEVRASVPGTVEAAESLSANEIPQTAVVQKGEAKVTIVYDGPPRFEAIEGTALAWAVNTNVPVIEVNGSFYACLDGIWYVGASPVGPFTVATSVPAEIYAIPPGSPLHYVTFVRVYGEYDDVVYVGYTPGYLGVCVWDGCLVWGTGFHHRPWIHDRWIGRPWTYGFGVGVRWTAEHGWRMGLGFGSRAPCRPWWGPLSGQHVAFFPVRTADAQVHLAFNNANVYRTKEGGAVLRWRAPERPARVEHPGTGDHVYTSPDGHVYRRSDEGWEHREGDAWKKPDARAHQQRVEQLEREQRSRERGETRVRETHNPSPAPVPGGHPGLGGGGFRGGGGGGFHGGGGGRGR